MGRRVGEAKTLGRAERRLPFGAASRERQKKEGK